MHRRPDTELAVLVREGSAEAAGVLFDRYWVLAWRIRGDRGSADDSAQEAFVKAFVKAFAALGRFDETQPFAPWLKRIAINAAVDPSGRSRRLEVVSEDDSAFHTWALGESAEDDLRRWAVADAVAWPDDSPPHRGKPPVTDAVHRAPRGHPARLRPI